ncbi:MAG: cytochrome b/b6 domain-containing protein [Rubrivivax sp.]
MTTLRNTMGVVLLAAAAAAAGGAGAAGTAAPRATLRPLHPDFALLDADGRNVLASGRAVSTMKSCGQCHDSAYIASHAFHADLGLRSYAPSERSWDASPGLFGRWDPLRYRFLTQAGDERPDLSTPDWLMSLGERVVGGGPAVSSRGGRPLATLVPDAADPEASHAGADGSRAAWDWAASGTMEMDCFVCHLDRPDLASRTAALRAGRFGEAVTATLRGRGLVEPGPGGWQWNRAAFGADGRVDSRKLALQDPTSAQCAACHGEAHPAGAVPVQVSACDLQAPQTATTGQVFAAQRISNSGLNLARKGTLTRSWDVHAERQLQCTDCHHALNNPAHAKGVDTRRPAHLRYDPRTLDIGDYLQRPDHDLARGPGARTAAAGGPATMRRCENCHDATESHAGLLPYLDTHLATLACETCHVPRQYAPAIEAWDWTVLQADGNPARSCRGVDGEPGDLRSLVTGFDPVLLQRTDTDGHARLAPYNLVTSFYWTYEDAKGHRRPVRLEDLRAAFLDGSHHAAAIVAAFDADRDGLVNARELRLDTPAKQEAVKARLAALGLRNVRVEGQARPYAINHGVARGEFALRDCASCHGPGSRIAQGLQLAAFAPVQPALAAGPQVVASGEVEQRADGTLWYQPVPARDALYVFGASRLGWVDTLGLLALAGTLAGVSGHGLLRFLAWRRRGPAAAPTERVRMYDAYRRFWHWLQAASILLLLATGLVIHRPDWFAFLDFPGVVALHNVVAAILVINAALSLFFHLATERMREYLPRPYGFIDDSVRQARFYVSGIFKGEPHPFEKRPDDRMNPIQKLTYFGILNVLLPAQIATGALMWGAQRWPEAAAALGGLPLLAPVHSMLAWLFGCFIVGHVYLTTTGATPLEAIRGMVTGYEDVEVHGAGGHS